MSELRELLALYSRERGGSLAETEGGVRELSPMFNGVTPHRPGYLASGRLRRAYVHYYLPVNAEKVARVLAELDLYAPAEAPPRVLDFGCGPGTASIALLLKRKVADLCLVDTVDEALDDAQWFARQLGVEARRAHEPPPGEKFDLILAANVYSETTAKLEGFLELERQPCLVHTAFSTLQIEVRAWTERFEARCHTAPQLPAKTPIRRQPSWSRSRRAWGCSPL